MAQSAEKYLLDSSIWVALFLEDDPNHKEAKKIIAQLEGSTVYLPYSILSETVTVLTYKHSKKQAHAFLDFVSDNRSIVLFDNTISEEISFYTRLNKRISFADASLVCISRKENIAVLTFDKQLRSELRKG